MKTIFQNDRKFFAQFDIKLSKESKKGDAELIDHYKNKSHHNHICRHNWNIDEINSINK